MSKDPALHKALLVLFGVCLAITLLETGLRIASFTILSIQERKNIESIKQKGSYRIMCLGESTTRNQYPRYLEEVLNKRSIGIKFSVIDKGLVGTNTELILSQLELNLNKYHPDMVITMMGINDDGSHMPYEATAKSKIILTLRSFKVYKLIRLLGLHITTKSRETHKEQNLFQNEQALKKDLEISPNDYSAHKKLGEIYFRLGEHVEAEKELKKAIEINPDNDSAHQILGEEYKRIGRYAEAEQEFRKAMELNPNNFEAYNFLSILYRRNERFSEAEQILLVGNKKDARKLCKALGYIYINQKRFTEAEQMFKKALELTRDDDCYIGGLAMIYFEMGNKELSKLYFKEANNQRNKFYNPTVVNNYHKLKRILDRSKVRLVCVQYPVRNIEPLKKIFQEESDGIVFVGNEKIFKDAVRNKSYKEYFEDMFGGDFGHCTEKGNKLLAENIANTILKEVFGR